MNKRQRRAKILGMLRQWGEALATNGYVPLCVVSIRVDEPYKGRFSLMCNEGPGVVQSIGDVLACVLSQLANGDVEETERTYDPDQN